MNITLSQVGHDGINVENILEKQFVDFMADPVASDILFLVNRSPSE